MINFGRIPWFDEHLGIEDGSRLGYKIIGLLIIIGTFLYMADLVGPIVDWIFGSGRAQ
jgi:hypothetical protein